MVKKHVQQFEIMRHELVPLHEILSDEEKNRILEKYNMTIDQFPKILNTDPVCLSTGANPGHVVRVTRNSRTAKKAVAYRLVVESD